MPAVTVVVVNFNGYPHVERCLESLTRQTFADHMVIVIDNASTDGSVARIRELFPSVKLIQNSSNVGFAAALNQAIAATTSPYFATLNPDAWAEPSWLESLVAAMIRSDRIGMAASQMRFADRPNIVNSTGIALDVIGIAWDRGGGLPIDQASDLPRNVFGASGGAALYRRAMLDDVGQFDEDFFMYLEDVDLAWRARLAGWQAVYVPEAIVYHHHSASAVEGSAFKSFHLGRNKLWTIAKNATTAHLIRYGLAMLAYDIMATFFAISQGQNASVRGRLAGLIGLPRMIRKRSTIKHRTTWRELRSALAGLERPTAIQKRYQHIRRPESGR